MPGYDISASRLDGAWIWGGNGYRKRELSPCVMSGRTSTSVILAFLCTNDLSSGYPGTITLRAGRYTWQMVQDGS